MGSSESDADCPSQSQSSGSNSVEIPAPELIGGEAESTDDADAGELHGSKLKTEKAVVTANHSVGQRMAVVGDPNGWYVRDLQRAARQARQELTCFSFTDLKAEISCQADSLQATASSNLAGFAAVLVRTMPLGSLEQVIFRMDCLQLVESSGIPVINPPRCLEVAIDKWLTLHRLHQFQIAVPPTVACQGREEALQAFQRLGEDVVVKPIFGGEGRGMIRVSDVDMAWRVFSTLQQTRSVIYIQQFIEHLGYDIRVLKIGDRCYSVKRYATGGNWRTNVAQGSRVEPHSLSGQEFELVSAAALAVTGEGNQPTVLGVDLLPCVDGILRVLEVNAVPGWRALARVLDLDVAAEILKLAAGHAA